MVLESVLFTSACPVSHLTFAEQQMAQNQTFLQGRQCRKPCSAHFCGLKRQMPFTGLRYPLGSNQLVRLANESI